jgi:hypothetical protein
MKLTTFSKDNQNKKIFISESILEFQQQIENQNETKDLSKALINQELKQGHHYDNDSIST